MSNNKKQCHFFSNNGMIFFVHIGKIGRITYEYIGTSYRHYLHYHLK